MKLFLGGTVGNNDWRDKFTKSLVDAGVPVADIFDPVVKDWNEAAREVEEKAKAECRYMMFFISDPRVEGINISAYSMVEATMGLYDKPKTTVVVFDKFPFSGHVLKAMTQTENVLRKRHPEALIFGSMDEAVEFFVKELAV
jgi:hypothetical protein